MEFGNGASITYGTTGTTAVTTKFNEIGSTDIEAESIEDPSLDITGFKEYEFGSLLEPGGFDCEAQVDSGSALPNPGTAETITITFASGATLAGTGAITKVPTGAHRNNQPLFGNLSNKWDGKTGPTFTPSA